MQTITINSNNPLLMNHHVSGISTLPGLAYIDLIYQEIHKKTEDIFLYSMRDLTIYQPLQINDQEEWTLKINMTIINNGYEIHIVGNNINKSPEDVVTLVTAKVLKNIKKPFKTDRVEEYNIEREKNITEIYNHYQERELVHGDFMKVTGKLIKTETRFKADLSLHPKAASSAEAFLFNPALLDGAAVSLGYGVKEQIEVSGVLYLPLYIEQVDIWGFIQDECTVLTDLKDIRFTGDLLKFSIEFLNKKGQPLVVFKNFSAKKFRNDTTVSSFKESTNRDNVNYATVGNAKKYLIQLFKEKSQISNSEIQPDSGFYELGLVSSELLTIVNELQQKIGEELSPTLLFEYTTIQTLADYLENTYPSAFNSSSDIKKPIPESINKELNDKTQTKETDQDIRGNDIAIIGLSGRYPMADDLDAFWDNLVKGTDAITTVPDSRWDWSNFEDQLTPSGKPISKWGGFINNVASFDAPFFKVSPKEAETLDPQERWFLQTCWEAIEDAGYTPDNIIESEGKNKIRKVGVFAGVMHKDYSLIGLESLKKDGTTLSLNYAPIPNRVSYFCNFHGPSMAVDTVCSSSLTAIHLAIQSLQNKECKVALAGGVNLSLHPAKYLSYGMSNFHATDGRCKAFGENGDGYVSSEGVGVAVLKPLTQAIKDKDTIYAVIKGSTINHVGKVSGITVPGQIAQQELIADCYKKSNINPEQITYIEAHGTGTALGDPIEIEGLTKAFRRYTDKSQYCSIGSLKSSIGHTEAAAGIGALTKVALQLKNKKLVPSLHAEEENKFLKLSKTPFYVQKSLENWEQGSSLRTAGISSFGATGTNVHLVIQEYEDQSENKIENQLLDNNSSFIVPISAKNNERLKEYASKLLVQLEKITFQILEQETVDSFPELSKKQEIVRIELRKKLGTILKIQEENIGDDIEWEEFGLEAFQYSQMVDWFQQEFQWIPNTKSLELLTINLVTEEIVPNKNQPILDSNSNVQEKKYLRDLAYTFQAGRIALEERVVFIVTSIAELKEKLHNYIEKDSGADFSANKNDHENLFSSFSNDEDFDHLVYSWLIKNKTFQIGELWAKGYPINWGAMYQTQNLPQRIKIPTYPFSKKEYWLPNTTKGSLFSSSIVKKKETILSPLVHKNNSGFKDILFTSSFTGEEFFFANHKIHDDNVLPGVAHIESAYHSFVLANRKEEGVIELVNINFIKPVIKSAETVDISIKLKKEANRVQFRLTDTNNGETIYSQGEICILTDSNKDQIDLAPYYDIKKYETLLGEELYEQFDRMGIHYEGAHKSINRVFYKSDEVAVQLELEDKWIPTLSSYKIHPGLVDSALQATLMLEKNKNGEAGWKSLRNPKMPFGIESIKIYGNCTAQMWAVARLNNYTHSGDTISDIKLYNKELELVIEIKGFITKGIKETDKNLSTSFLSNAQPESNLKYLIPKWESINLDIIDVLQPDEYNRSILLCINCPEAEKKELQATFKQISFIGDEELIDSNFKVLADSNIRFDHIFWWVREQEEALEEAQEKGIYFGFKLIRACVSNAYNSLQLAWTVITPNTIQIDSFPEANPCHSGVDGLVGSAIKEFPKWKMRSIDTSDASHEIIQQILTIPFDKEGRSWVLRENEWYRQKLTELKIVPHQQTNKSAYRQNGIYIIIGGSGNIGRAMSRYLIQNFNAQVIWIGRSTQGYKIEEQLRAVGTDKKSPFYYKADVTQKSEIQSVLKKIKERFGTIHGVINSAMVLQEHAIESVTEKDFKAGYETKQKSILNLIEVLNSTSLDFLLLFSSMVSFIKTPRLSYYAAGSVFMDSYGLMKKKELPFPIKTVNWGYWNSKKLEEATDFEKLQAIGIHPINDTEGIEALNVLMESDLDQIGIMKLSKPLEFSGYNKEYSILLLDNVLQLDIPTSLITKQYTTNEQLQDLHNSSVFEDQILTDLIAKIACYQLQSIGLFTNQPIQDNILTWGVPAYFKDWFEQCLCFFGEQELCVETSKNTWEINEDRKIEISDPENLWKEWDNFKKIYQENPDKIFHIELVEATLRGLPSIIKNELRPTDILFPNSSMAKVVNVYKNNKISDYYNEVLGACVLTYIQKIILDNPNRKIRILEVGAGTGGTSELLFRKIAPFQNHIQEYCYTDISQAFLNFAETTYGAGKPYLTFRKFNAEECIESQKFEIGVYDIVIGTNVLHATSNIRTSLKNCQSLLKPEGAFLLNEMSKNVLFTHLTFGLLEGWWLAKDKETRIPGCPGLSSLQWKKVLLQSGYKSVKFPVSKTHHLGQQIIWAQATSSKIKSTQLTKKPYSKQKIISSAKETNKRGLESKLMDYLRELVSNVLKLPIEEVRAGESFENYGIDSILIVQLTNELRKDFDKISGTLFFEHQTLSSMVSYFMKERKADVNNFFENKEKDIVANHQTISSPDLSKNSNSLYAQDNKQEDTFLEKKDDNNASLNFKEEIAIIGVSGQYPKAENIQEFWDNLKNGVNCTSEIPKDRWDWQMYFGDKNELNSGSYSKWGGFLKDIDAFDPLFFKISPLEAEKIDPQERLFLQCAYSSIEDAGYLPENLSNTKKVGVFAGVMNSTYNRQSNHWSISNRVSYALDFQGPSLTVDTACSSSLMAIYLAFESLQNGNCDCAIAGGVNLIITPGHYNRLASANMLSEGKHNKTFAAGADGFVDAEGVGAIVLKPKSKAIADGDHIYGVIKGGSTNSGGRTSGYTVPNPIAQADLIKTAIERSGVHPETINYVEAHGTGTSLGDPIEIAGLSKAFDQFTTKTQFCAIGSSKSNIGHCEGAAGIGGLTKILLQFKKKQLVPSLHSETINPEINFESSPFYIQSNLKNWDKPVIKDNGIDKFSPRRAGISSFGAGGTNVHLIIEEFEQETTVSNEKELILLSAATQEQLVLYANKLYKHLTVYKENRSLKSIAYTLQTGRKNLEYRLAIEVDSVQDLEKKLFDYTHDHNNSSIYQGTVSQIKEEIPERTSEIKESFRTHKWSVLAQLWVQGEQIHWHELYTLTPLKASLPTYPFAKERYWKPESEAVLSSNNLKKEAPIFNEQPQKTNFIELTEAVPYYTETYQVFETETKPLVIHESDIIIKSKYETGYTDLQGKEYYLEDLKDKEDWDDILKNFRGKKILWIHPETTTDPLMKNYKSNIYDNMLSIYRMAKSCFQFELDTVEKEFILITKNGFTLPYQPENINPDQTAISGFAGVMSKEFTNWKTIRIDSAEPVNQIPIIQNDSENWLVRKEKFYQKKMIRCTPNQTFKSAYVVGGTYLIIGGAGGVGTEWSRYLVKNYQASIIWVGRRKKDTVITAKMKDVDTTGKHITYYQTDVADYDAFYLLYNTIKKEQGAINGVIHAAMASTDQEIILLNEPRFMEGLKAKIDVSITLGKVFQKEPLDFMLFFSSVGALANTKGQSCYVTSSSFKDSFSKYLDKKVFYPVKVINWGYWGEVGFGEFIPDSLKTVLKEQVGVLGSIEANHSLESFLSTKDQQAVITAKSSFSTLIPLDNAIEIKSIGQEYKSILNKLSTHLPDRQLTIDTLRDNARFGVHEMETLLSQWMFVQLQSIGLLVNSVNDLEQQKVAGNFNKFYDKWLEESLRVLQNNNLIEIQNKSLVYCIEEKTRHLKLNQIESNWHSQKSNWGNDTYKKAQVKLLESSMKNLPNVLIGKMKGAEVVFPDSSMELVEGIYKNELGDYFNDVLTDNIIAFIKERIQQDPNAKIRLLEVGAGIGGTSSIIFQRIKPYHQYIEEYCYTDISKAFLLYAEKEYGEDNSFLSYNIFDVGVKAPQDQILKTYDIVLATNVLHATDDIRNTLVNVKSVLKKNGVILINEISTKSLFFHMGFALLDGWWLYNDPELRIEGCPGLAPETWNEILISEGFEDVTFPANIAHDLGQQIIVAQSDGVVLRKVEESIEEKQEVIEVLETKKQLTKTVITTEKILEDINNTIKTSFSDLLKIPLEKLKNTTPLLDYGLDSILAVKLVKSLNQSLEIKLESSKLFEYDTIHKLSEYIVEQYYSETIHDTLKKQHNKAAKFNEEHIIDAIKSTIHETLKIPKTKIKQHLTFYDYGLDSILAVEVSKKLNTALNTSIETTDLIKFNTIDLLTQYLVNNEEFDIDAGEIHSAKNESKHIKKLDIKHNDSIPEESFKNETIIKILEEAKVNNFSIKQILQRIN